VLNHVVRHGIELDKPLGHAGFLAINDKTVVTGYRHPIIKGLTIASESDVITVNDRVPITRNTSPLAPDSRNDIETRFVQQTKNAKR